MIYQRIKYGLCGLYCFKNIKNEIIYIGKADDIYKRLKTHKHLPQECYSQIDKIEFTVINNKADRDILELILINQFRPKYNTAELYDCSPTLLVSSDIMLIWHTDTDVERFNFSHKIKHSKETGRPRINIPNNFETYYTKWKNNEITAVECASATGLTKTTFYRIVKKYESEKALQANPVPSLM